MTKTFNQYLVQLWQNGKFKRYLRDDRSIPFCFSSSGEANLFAKQYLSTRRRKSFSIKVVSTEIQLPKPEIMGVL